MCKIALIRPSYSDVYTYYKRDAVEKRQINPPLGLLYLAAYVRDVGGYNISLVDAEVELLSPKNIAERLSEMKVGLVGITATTAEIVTAAKIAAACKKRMPKISIVVGGSHVTAFPVRSMKEFPAFDIVARGEGELILKDLADALIAKKKTLAEVAGICYRTSKGTIVSTDSVGFVKDFDKLPMPAWDLVDMKDYLYPMGKRGMQKSAMVQTARGCPHNCIFCFQQFGKRVRFRSPKKVLDEVCYLKEKKGVEFINFVDDTFMLNREHAKELLNLLIESNMGIQFKCMTRADSISKDLVELTMRAGCVRLSMGIESGNEEMLKRIKKGTTKDMYRQAYRIINECGIECRGSFILGLPHETVETIADTVAFSKELDLYHAAFNIATPYPGTELFQFAEKGDGYEFVKEDFGWSEFRRWGNAVAVPTGFTKEEMLIFQRFAHAEFYSQPKIIGYYMDLMNRLDESYFYFRPFIDGLTNYWNLVLKEKNPLYTKLRGLISERIG